MKNLEAGYHFKKNPDQYTAFAQLTKGTATPNSQGLRLGNFVQIRDVIEGEMENVFAGKKTAKQGLDDAVAKSNEILKEFAAAQQAVARHRAMKRTVFRNRWLPYCWWPRRWRSPSSSSSGRRSKSLQLSVYRVSPFGDRIHLRRARQLQPSCSPTRSTTRASSTRSCSRAA